MAIGSAAPGTEAHARVLARAHSGDVLDFPAVRDRRAGGELTITPKKDT